MNSVAANSRLSSGPGVLCTLVLALFTSGPAANTVFADPNPEIDDGSSAVLSVVATRPQTEVWPVAVPADGWLAPWHEAQISTEIGDVRIVELDAEVGDVVHKGDVLARLDCGTLQAELHQAEADEQAAEVALEHAQTDSARAEKMHGTGAQSERDYKAALFAARSAQAKLDAAKANLDAARIRQNLTTIRAIDDGIISARTAVMGEVVSPGTELFRLICQQRVEWQAELASRQAQRVKVGMNAVLKLADGTLLEGKVRAVAPAASRDSASVIAYIALDANQSARAGTFATGSIEVGSAEALTLVDTALVLRDGMSYIFTIEGDRTVRQHRVTCGRRREGRVEILEGIAPGNAVVASGGEFLSDGAKVRVVESTGEGR